jgi:mono/diheme cytochrome c family protein
MIRILAIVLACLLAGSVFAQDPKRGRELYEMYCLSCHYERIHKRDSLRSLIRSQTALRVEIARRAEQVTPPRQFSIADLDDIAEYLNRSHYRLDK